MNPAAIFAAHRTAILGGAAAAVAGLALLSKRKKTAAGGPVTAGATVPGTLPAAAIVGAQGPDSSSYDLYNALQPELEQLRQTVGSPAPSVSAPLASTLFAPTGSGNYVHYSNGLVAEVESDGSLYHLTPSEWAAEKSTGRLNNFGSNVPVPRTYDAAGNLAAKNGSQAVYKAI